MKIAFFSDCFLDLTGGIVTSIEAQKAELEKLGHTVYVFSTGFPRTDQEIKKLTKQNIFQVPSCKLFFRGLTPVSRRPKIVEHWLLENYPEIKDFDVFYIHYEGGCSIAGLRLGRRLKVPTVQVMHGREDMGEANIVPLGFRTIVASLLSWFHSWYVPHLIRVGRDGYLADTVAKAKMWTLMVNHANFADYVVCPSRHFAKKLKYYGVKYQIHIMPNGYKDANFPTDPPIKSLKSGQPLRIIWHSRLSGEKRIMPFLQALTYVTGRYHVDIYGGGPDLKLANRFAARHKLNVHFHGNVEFRKFQSVLQNAHLDVLASYNFDNYPLTLVEAEAAGVPVFFCDPDMKEIVPPGSYVLSSSEKPEDMAATLDDLIEHPEEIQKMSKVMLENRNEVLISNRIIILKKIFQNITDKQRK